MNFHPECFSIFQSIMMNRQSQAMKKNYPLLVWHSPNDTKNFLMMRLILKLEWNQFQNEFVPIYFWIFYQATVQTTGFVPRNITRNCAGSKTEKSVCIEENYFVMDGVFGESGHIVDIKFFDDVCAVKFYGPDAYE